MTLPSAIYVFRWLIRDTFRHSMANWTFWIMLGISGLVIVFCLSVGIEGGESLRPPDDFELTAPHGRLILGFGAFRGPLFRDGQEAVRFLQAWLAEWIAGTAGILLMLILTAGFVPTFVEPSAAAVLMAKPVPRWVLLLGKYVGVLGFVAFQVSIFVIGTWLALGLRTGFWPPAYLLCIPILVLHFAAVYSFSVLLGVTTRSTVACVFGSILFWLVCWGVNYGRHFVVSLPHLQPQQVPFSDGTRGMAEASYWILPKPADFAILLHESLGSAGDFTGPQEWQVIQAIGAFHPELTLLSSFIFAIVLLGISARQLITTDY